MAGCTALALVGQLLVPAAIGTPALLWPLLVLLGGLMGGLYTLSLALIGERFRGADLTQANTAFVMTFQLGAIVGPPYAGAVDASARAGDFPAGAGPAAGPGRRRCSPGGRALATARRQP